MGIKLKIVKPWKWKWKKNIVLNTVQIGYWIYIKENAQNLNAIKFNVIVFWNTITQSSSWKK